MNPESVAATESPVAEKVNSVYANHRAHIVHVAFRITLVYLIYPKRYSRLTSSYRHNKWEVVKHQGEQRPCQKDNVRK